MGKMPIDRAKQWDSLFRRYGIADDSEPEDKKQETERLDGLQGQIKRALLPEEMPIHTRKRSPK